MFRDLHQIALERLCVRILAEAGRVIGDSGASPHQRYLQLFNLIQKRDRDIARGFNDLRRSTALTQMAIIHSMGLWTPDELHRLSPETLQFLEQTASLFGAP